MTVRNFAACLLLALFFSPALAHELAAYVVAVREFSSRTFRFGPKLAIPRLNDPDSAQLLAILSDAKRFLGPGAFNSEEIKELKALCGEAGKVTMSYMAFNLSQQIAKPTPEIAASKDRLRAVMDSNTRVFQPEIALMFPFGIKCSAEEARLTGDIFRGLASEEITPRQHSDLRAFRATILNSYIYVLPDVIDERLTVSYRAVFLKAFADTTGIFKSVLRPQERMQVIELIGRLRPSVPSQMLESLAVMEMEMNAAECIDLCAVEDMTRR